MVPITLIFLPILILIWQHTKYQGVVQITPTPSGIPVATVGGGEGRAPVVVDDPAGNDKAGTRVAVHEQAQTTEGIQAGAVPGPNVFEHKVAEPISSDVESKPSQTPQLSSSINGGAAAIAAADEGAPVLLPPVPEDLATPEEAELVQSTTSTLDLKPDVDPPKENAPPDSKKLGESVPKGPSHPEEDKTEEAAEDLERVQKELFDEA